MTPEEVQAATNAFCWQPSDRPSGGDGRLAGKRVAIKDNIVERGVPVTCGSQLLARHIGAYDAAVIERIRAAGGILVGRTNMDEFGMGSSTEHCAWGTVRNPHDLDRVPGGSSGGSAVAVATGLADMALGSDTGGSVRQPAAFTGVVGLKPTYGRVSRHGLVAYASSTDVIGPMARSVDEVATLFEVIAGPDPADATSTAFPERPVPDTLTIGVFGDPRCDLDALTRAGHRLEPVALSTWSMAVACYYILAPAEASANLARYDGLRFGEPSLETDDLDALYTSVRTRGFGAEVKRRILIGTWVLSAGYRDSFYLKAVAARRRITAELDDVLSRVDVLITPTTPGPAFKIGEVEDPLDMYLGDKLTIPASLSGHPALSVPSARVGDLPLGTQIIGPRGGEDLCFAVGRLLERPITPAVRVSLD